MKKAVLLHGTEGSDKNYFWFADTKKYLETNGYTVWWPLLPHTEKPELTESRLFLEQHLPPLDDQAIIIGHSSACPLILSLLQNLDIEVRQVVLVSGFYQPFDDGEDSNRMLPDSFDWSEIRRKANEFLLINTDDDPWGCTDRQARPVARELKGILIVPVGQGHMGSTTYDQPYPEFQLLKRLLRV